MFITRGLNRFPLFLMLLSCSLLALSSACSPAETANTQNQPSNSAQVEVLPQPTKTPGLGIELELSVNGVSQGMSEDKVIALLGKPKEFKKGGEECSGGYHRYLIYEGLTVDVLNGDGKTYRVTEMDVTSSKWEIAPGVRIGDPISRVREVLGEPYSKENDVLFYGIDKNTNGFIKIFHKNGKLVRLLIKTIYC